MTSVQQGASHTLWLEALAQSEACGERAASLHSTTPLQISRTIMGSVRAPKSSSPIAWPDKIMSMRFGDLRTFSLLPRDSRPSSTTDAEAS